MNLFIPSFVRWRIVVLLVFIGALSGIGVMIYETFKVDKNFPTILTGVHHLGSNYYINRFYVNKSVSDNVGEGGGGGQSMLFKLAQKMEAGINGRCSLGGYPYSEGA